MKVYQVWIRVTVPTGRKAPGIDLLKRRPATLALNQFAYAVKIQYEEDDWSKRMKEVELPVMRPPQLTDRRGFDIAVTQSIVSKDVPTQVIDSLRFDPTAEDTRFPDPTRLER